MNTIDQYIASIFKALSHPIRLDIVKSLRDGPKCVCDILPLLKSEQSNASQHLSVLKNYGIIQRWKDGTKVMYGITDEKIFSLIEDAQSILINQLEKKREAILRGINK